MIPTSAREERRAFVLALAFDIVVFVVVVATRDETKDPPRKIVSLESVRERRGAGEREKKDDEIKRWRNGMEMALVVVVVVVVVMV